MYEYLRSVGKQSQPTRTANGEPKTTNKDDAFTALCNLTRMHPRQTDEPHDDEAEKPLRSSSTPQEERRALHTALRLAEQCVPYPVGQRAALAPKAAAWLPTALAWLPLAEVLVPCAKGGVEWKEAQNGSAAPAQDGLAQDITADDLRVLRRAAPHTLGHLLSSVAAEKQPQPPSASSFGRRRSASPPPPLQRHAKNAFSFSVKAVGMDGTANTGGRQRPRSPPPLYPRAAPEGEAPPAGTVVDVQDKRAKTGEEEGTHHYNHPNNNNASASGSGALRQSKLFFGQNSENGKPSLTLQTLQRRQQQEVSANLQTATTATTGGEPGFSVVGGGATANPYLNTYNNNNDNNNNNNANKGLFSRRNNERTSYFNNADSGKSRKAPPYAYNNPGSNEADSNANNNNNNYNNYNNNNNNNNTSGSFVTAGQQLVADVKSGRAQVSNLGGVQLGGRAPQLGLRRSGFQPPFRQEANNAEDANPNAMPIQKVLRSVTSHNNSKGQKAKGKDDDDEVDEDFPASLLLPDGTVPPQLQGLDAKLVAQVAMEIVEHAGAKEIGWEDIAGLDHAKSSVEEAIVWPLRRPDLFVGLRDPPRGLLLFGPPGTGKTMIARAIANRAQCTFLNISAASLMSKWLGEGEKLVRCLFAVAAVKQPSIIFIDEVDSLLSMRGEGEMDSVRRVKTEFLVQMDGVGTDRGERVLLIGATNRPDELDEAARRRLEKRLYIPLPDLGARRFLIQHLLDQLETSTAAAAAEGAGRRAAVHSITEADLDHLAAVTAGYSGADLKQLCREAAMGPLREVGAQQLSGIQAHDLRPIRAQDFRAALRRLKTSVGPEEVTRYVEWNRTFGSFAEEDDEHTQTSTP